MRNARVASRLIDLTQLPRNNWGACRAEGSRPACADVASLPSALTRRRVRRRLQASYHIALQLPLHAAGAQRVETCQLLSRGAT